MKKPYKVFARRFLSSILIICFGSDASALEATFEGKSTALELVVANTDESRRKGLMFQSELKLNSGMIFIWPESKKHCMWMKNTSIPLSVAYLSADGRIKEIYDMVPFSEESICSRKNVRMAVEVNQGWFLQNKVAIGDRINF